MKFKKTIFVTVLTVFTAGAFNQAMAQQPQKPASAQDILTWFGAIAGGVVGYNNMGNSDRGAKTAGMAILGAIAGNFIGKNIDESNAREMSNSINGCVGTRSNCSWSSSDGSYSTNVIYREQVVRGGLQCGIYQINIMTPQGPTVKNQCICYEGGSYVVRSVEEDNRYMSDLENEKQRLKNRVNSYETRRNVYRTSGSGNSNGSGYYGRGGLSEADLDAQGAYYDKMLSQMNSANSRRSGSGQCSADGGCLDNGSGNGKIVNGKSEEVLRVTRNSTTKLVRRLSDGILCEVDDAFLQAKFGYLDEVCRQGIHEESEQLAFDNCASKSSTSRTCISKNQIQLVK